MLSEERRELLGSYQACEALLLEPKKSRAAVLSTLMQEIQLERDARLIDPYVCIDTNGFSYALYIGDQPLAPLGVCIRRHFSNFSDFLWLERTERSSAKRELWSAVLVQDGLATDAALNVPRADLREMLSEIYTPINIITAQRSLIEAWLPRSLGQGGQALWVETSVSPLAGAVHLAKLELINDALRSAGLKINTKVIKAAVGAAVALALAVAVGGIYLFASGNTLNIPFLSSADGSAANDPSIDPLETSKLQQRAVQEWEQSLVWSKYSTSHQLKAAYDLLLEGWSLGLQINQLIINETGEIELRFSGAASDNYRPLVEAWCRLRHMTLNDTGPASGTLLTQTAHFPRYESLRDTTARAITEEELRSTASHLRALPLKAEAASTPSGAARQNSFAVAIAQDSPGAATREVQYISMTLPSFGTPQILLYLAEDQSLSATFLKEFSVQVDSDNLSLNENLQLTVGSWRG